MATASASHKETDLDVKARRGKTIFTISVFDKMAQCALLFDRYVLQRYKLKNSWLFRGLAFIPSIYKQIFAVPNYICCVLE